MSSSDAITTGMLALNAVVWPVMVMVMVMVVSTETDHYRRKKELIYTTCFLVFAIAHAASFILLHFTDIGNNPQFMTALLVLWWIQTVLIGIGFIGGCYYVCVWLIPAILIRIYGYVCVRAFSWRNTAGTDKMKKSHTE
jgi:hypothetical protein